MSPADQARQLGPLRRLAGDVDRVGSIGFSPVYSSVSIDADRNLIVLRLTDTSAGPEIIAAVRSSDPAALVRPVRVQRSVYSRQHLQDALQRFLARSHDGAIDAVAAAPDGSGLQVELGAGRAPNAVAQAGTKTGMPVQFSVAPRRVAKKLAWAAVKWHDSSPFIGGDLLTSNGISYCTAGLPAVRRSDGHPVMITARHCFGQGARVFTGGGPTGQFEDRQVGSYVGTVVARSTEWDADVLVGANNNADESDTGGWRRLTSVGYSYAGDYVCQSGALSFYLGHPTPCGIKVTNPDIWFRIGGHLARGVEGIDVLHGWGSHDGDSGATVFTSTSTGRQARGIISSGGADGTPDRKRVDWIEAPDILANFHLRLNPVT